MDAKRASEGRKFFSLFLGTFPELDKHHPHPKGFTASVFSALRGLGVFEQFDVSKGEKHDELQALVETIVRACLPSPDVPAVKSKAGRPRRVTAQDKRFAMLGARPAVRDCCTWSVEWRLRICKRPLPAKRTNG
jgi:hypothetical protein